MFRPGFCGILNIIRKKEGIPVLLFYALMLLLKASALLFLGMSAGSCLFAGYGLLESLFSIPLCLVMWLMGKGLHFLMGKPDPFLLTTPLRKALCAMVILAWGILGGSQF